MTPGELRVLLERCRVEDTIGWAAFSALVKARGRAVLSAIKRLSDSDREDIVSDALQHLMTAVRRNEILGQTNSEIDAYLCKAVRNRALNILRRDGRRRRAGEVAVPGAGSCEENHSLGGEATDTGPSPEERVVAAEQLGRAEKLLLSWPPIDRYIALSRLHGVPTRVVQKSLEQPPFSVFLALATVDTRFHRLKERLMRNLGES